MSAVKEAKVFVRFIPLGSEVEKHVEILATSMKRLNEIARPNPESLKAFKETSAIAVQISREEKAAAQAKSAKLSVSAKEVQLERQLLGLKEAQSKADRKNSPEDKTASYKAASYKAAMSDIAKIQRENARWEKAISAEIMRGDKLTADNKSREAKRGANEVISSLKKVGSESAKSVNETKSVFSQAFSGSFFGSLAGNISSFFLSQISQLPSKVAAILDDMVQISSERSNALKGLDSIATFKGIDAASAQEAVKNLRLVKAGVLEVGDATSGLKSLLQAGFSLPQAVETMERFSDAAAFGKQSALSYGEAISRAAEGIKNQNSELVDNVGLTKNLSVILKERGYELEDLTDKTKAQSAINALYNGILAETTAQVGDADKITAGYTGSVAALETAQKNLYAAIGDLITQSPELREANKILTEQINGYTDGVKNANSETGKFAKDALKDYAVLKAGIFSLAGAAKSGVEVIVGAIGYVIGAAVLTISGVIETALLPFRALVDEITRGFAGIINYAKQYSSIIGLANPAAGLALDALPEIKLPERDYSEFYRFTKTALGMMKQLDTEIRQAGNSFTGFVDDFKKTQSRVINSRYADANSDINNEFVFGRVPGVSKSKTNTSDTNSGDSTSAKSGKKSSDKKIADKLPAFGSLRSLVITSGNPQWDAWFNEMGQKFGVDPNILLLQAGKESSFKSNAVSPKGAKGFSQFMPATAERFNVNTKDVKDSIRGQAEYMSLLLGMFGGDYKKALAGYNAGEGAVQKYGGIPPYRETQDYVSKIQKNYVSKVGKNKGEYGFDFEKFAAEQSDAMTAAEKEKNIRSAIELYKMLGLIPDGAMLDRFRDVMVEDAKKTSAIQPTEDQVKKIFENIRLNRPQTEIASEAPPLATTIVTEGETNALKEYNSLLENLNDTIYDLVERTEEEKLSKQLLREEYALITPAQKEYLLGKAKEIDASRKAKDAQEEQKKAIEEAQEKYRDVFNETADRFEDAFTSIADRDWKGLFDSITGEMRRFLIRAAAEWATSKFFKLLTGQGVNPNAGQNGNFLSNITGGLFGGGNRGGSTGGLFGSIFSGATPPFVGNNLSSSTSNPFTSAAIASGAVPFGSSAADIARQQRLFEFGANYSNNGRGGAGKTGLLSSLMNNGAAQSGAFAVAAQAAQFILKNASPAKGFLAGGLLGGVLGFFNRSGLRKKEEKSRTQFLQDAFDGLKQFDSLIGDVRALRVEPSGAIATGESLAQSIRAAYLQSANALTDKKTKKHATQDVSRIDSIVTQKMSALREAVEKATSAGERANRLLPEFADGGMVSKFARNSGLFAGLVPGMYDRKDDKLIKVSGREVVLTPDQWMPITPYLKQKKVPGFADGGFVGMSQPTVAASSFTVELNNVTVNNESEMVIKNNADGKRQIIKLIKDAGTKGDIVKGDFRYS